MFRASKDIEITPSIVSGFISQHIGQIHRLKQLEDLYKGNHAIFHARAKDPFKPDNRLAVNYAKYIVDTFNGFFIGKPITIWADNEEVNDRLQEFRNRNTLDDNEAEISKMTSIYGQAFELLFQNEEGQTDATYINPINAFVVYDNTIQEKPLFGVYYTRNDKGDITGQALTKTDIIDFKGLKYELSFTDIQPHYYGDVPLIEYFENEERKGTFESVISLIDTYNKVISEKANDVEYFADAYIKILGADLDEDTLRQLRDNRIINLAGYNGEKIVVDFLSKPNADTTQENLLNRLEGLIYKISMIANINDETFGNASGVSLEYKLQPMKNLALTKERKFKASMQLRHKMWFNVPDNVPYINKNEWTSLNIDFKRNLPHNISDEADTMQKLSGLLSDETLLSISSIVSDPKAEMDRINEQKNYGPYDLHHVNEVENGDQLL